MALTLPELPYAKSALEPHMSAKTLEFHHDKHHNAYVVNYNKLVDGTDLASKDLLEVLQLVEKDSTKAGIFNNGAQVWNHTFFWNSMKPNGGGAPTGKVAELINRDFGSYDKFREAFVTAATTQFGSGWAWLVSVGGKLEVRKTSNAATPVTEAGVKPLVVIDVWEHAYYLDHQNLRPRFVETFLDQLVNWDFANQNL